MNENFSACLSHLDATPEILHLLVEGLSEEDRNWKPAADRFSVAEVLEHLSHVEGQYFRLRVERMMEEERPALEPYNQDELAAAGQYSGRDAEDSFDHFEEQRENNLEYLQEITDVALERAANDPEVGTISITHLINEWAFHDLGHIRQISEIIRAVKFYPRMGPFQRQYKVNP